jgi:kinesin family member 1
MASHLSSPQTFYRTKVFVDKPESTASYVQLGLKIKFENTQTDMTTHSESNARVKAIVRIKPLNPRNELGRHSKECCSPSNVDPSTTLSIFDPVCFNVGVKPDMMRSWSRDFSFDKCLWSNDKANPLYATQEDLFEEIGQPVIEWITTGFNCCVFAFGQTGSGKTYSMMGNISGDPLQYGLIPRICYSLFDTLHEQSMQDSSIDAYVTFSHMEIYKEHVRDLLTPHKNAPVTLKVREHPQKGVFVEKLTHVRVTTFEEVMQLIEIGDKNRTVASTLVNKHSSRSHAIVTLTVVQRVRLINPNVPTAGLQKQEGRVHLVDLAGSERVALSGAKNLRLKEACSINKSLSVLGDVILSLGSNSRRTHIPYRNSVLTHVLKDSLGGNAHAIMVATISPSAFDYEETMSTLKYAERAKKVRMRVDANVTSGLLAGTTNAVTLVPLLQAEVLKLKEMLAAQQAESLQMQEKLVSQSNANSANVSREEQVESDDDDDDIIVPPKAHNKVGTSPGVDQSDMRTRVAELEQQLAEREELIVQLELAKFRDHEETTTDLKIGWNNKAENSYSPSSVSSINSNIAIKDPKSIDFSTEFRAHPSRAVLASEARKDHTPRLVNLNQDPLFSECLVYYLPQGEDVWAGSHSSASVPLAGPDAREKHCMIRQEDEGKSVITPMNNAKVYVNGRIITENHILWNHDRIAFGRFHLFRYDTTGNNDVQSPPTWEMAQRELQVVDNNEDKIPKQQNSSKGHLQHNTTSKLMNDSISSPEPPQGSSFANIDLDGSLGSALEFLDAYDWDVPKSPMKQTSEAKAVDEKGKSAQLDEFDAYYEYLNTPTKTTKKDTKNVEAENKKQIMEDPMNNQLESNQVVAISLEKGKNENEENSTSNNSPVPDRLAFEDEAEQLKADLLNMQATLQARMQRYSSMTPTSPS